jgi:hypothetical protein
MTKILQIRIAISDDNKLVTVEDVKGFSQDKVESHLAIIGLLENLKQHHLDKLNKLYEKTIKR